MQRSVHNTAMVPVAMVTVTVTVTVTTANFLHLSRVKHSKGVCNARREG
jgi:hypothetical protein